MAITTFAQLKSAIATWAHNTALTDVLGDFVTLAEGRIRRDLKPRAMQTETTLTASVGSRFINLPSNYGEAISVRIDTDTRLLPQVLAESAVVSTANSRPRTWSVDGARLAFDCPADQAYSVTLRYHADWGLSDDEPTNSVLTDYPDLYLFAALVEAGMYMRDQGLAQMADARYQAAVANAQEAERDSEGRSSELQFDMPTASDGAYDITGDR